MIRNLVYPARQTKILGDYRKFDARARPFPVKIYVWIAEREYKFNSSEPKQRFHVTNLLIHRKWEELDVENKC